MSGFGTGLVVFAGIGLLASEIPKPWLLRALGRPAITHVGIGLAAYISHSGSFDGLVAAATAEVLSASAIKFLRSAIGFIEPGKQYTPGWMRDYTSILGTWDEETSSYITEPELNTTA